MWIGVLWAGPGLHVDQPWQLSPWPARIVTENSCFQSVVRAWPGEQIPAPHFASI